MGKLVVFLLLTIVYLVWLSSLPEYEKSQIDRAPKWSEVQTYNPQRTVDGRELQGE